MPISSLLSSLRPGEVPLLGTTSASRELPTSRCWRTSIRERGDCRPNLEQAKAVAGTGSKAITEAVPVYLVADASTSDLWVRQADAVSFTTDETTKEKLVVFEVDVDTLDTNGGFDCLCLKAGASNAANIISATYIVTGERYHGSSVIVD